MKFFKAFLLVAVMLVCAVETQAAGKKAVSGVVNINTATASELMMLPGIGPSKAQAILDYRKDRPFEKPEDLKEVKGIGDKLFAAISPNIAVGGPSTATAAAVPAPQKANVTPATGSAGKAY